jgi:hypothetical protein
MKAYNLLEDYLLKFGQLLPIEIENIGLNFIFNITTENDCFDNENSLYNLLIYQNPENWYDTKYEIMSGKIAKEKGFNSDDLGRVDGGDWNSVLKKDKITSPLFYTKDRGNFMGPFCTSGFFNEEEEFFHLYHKHNLTGLEFREVKLT